MFGFGKKDKQAASPPPQGSGSGLPWEPDFMFAANLAIGNLSGWLMESLKTERGIHAETLLAATGVMAGAAANDAALEAAAGSGTPIMVAEGADGRSYIFGDLLNKYLVPEDPAVVPVWAFAAAGAVKAGLAAEDLPDYTEIFRHVTASVGGAEFGVIRNPPNCDVHLTVDQAMDGWTSAKTILSRSDHPGHGGQALPVRFWPGVLGAVAQQHIVMTKDVVAPASAVKIVMEAAVFASKIDRREAKPA